MSENKVEQAEAKAHEGVSQTADKVNTGMEVASDEYTKVSKKAEEHIDSLKAEIAELKRNAGPKIQEAENFLTSSSAISFYKGLITGVAIVVAYQKYNTSNRF